MALLDLMNQSNKCWVIQGVVVDPNGTPEILNSLREMTAFRSAGSDRLFNEDITIGSRTNQRRIDMIGRRQQDVNYVQFEGFEHIAQR